jgi:NADH-quinone oxidoreductase subunit G
MESRNPAVVMGQIASQIPDYSGLSYAILAEVTEQWPIVGREDLYYGGTTYENRQGLGVQLTPAAQRGAPIALGWTQPAQAAADQEIAASQSLIGVPVSRLYDRGQTILPSKVLRSRLPEPYVALNPVEADRLKIGDGATAEISVAGIVVRVIVKVDEGLSDGVVLVPRSLGIPVTGPTPVSLRLVEKMIA